MAVLPGDGRTCRGADMRDRRALLAPARSTDVNDVIASVWLRLVDNLGTIREPEALPGWLRTTTRHESFKVLRHRNRQIPTDDAHLFGAIDPEHDAALIREERTVAARQAFTRLPSPPRRSSPPTASRHQRASRAARI